MKTPICDFIQEYIENDNLRLHMPGHKGVGAHGEAHDITEFSGADSLYEARGIISESERIAGELFGAHTFYSTEGSSLSIRAMMYLVCLYAKKIGRKPLVLAGRNAHKAFVSAAALLDFDVEWLMAEGGSYLSCKIGADEIKTRLERADELPVAVYITSPDYLGNITDVEGIARVCHERGVLLLVDNAHGAYLHFLPKSRHPIALGADMCCDSAHKTLPALTGAAYLHISKSAPDTFKHNAKGAMALFGSTSPSYLILESLDRVNAYLADGYRERLLTLIEKLDRIKSELSEFGFELMGDEPMKLTVAPQKYGYTGTVLGQFLEHMGVMPEFYDNDATVLMPTPENTDKELEYMKKSILDLPKREQPLTVQTPRFSLPEKAMSIREAVTSPQETVRVCDSAGYVLAAATVSCPPAVPIVMPGEVITEEAIEVFKHYGILECSVVKE